ncbi:MAG: pyridoxamine 5'-phosphate oxidase family protein [Desulfobacterota bacterium]|nr:pyridoxamine 5'-phosphate oxidase family protein [Thermodesulfobacteriota bacterium]
MRRPERRMDQKVLQSLLRRSSVGRLATINRAGYPVIKPVNFIYMEGKLYLHSSPRGEKIADLRRGSPVCFELDEPIAYAPASGHACWAGYFYRSVFVKGKAKLLKDPAQKQRVLQRLMEKYQPEGGYGPIPPAELKKTAIVEISIEEMTGKEKLD